MAWGASARGCSIRVGSPSNPGSAADFKIKENSFGNFGNFDNLICRM